MATLSLTWNDLNIGEDGFNIYRSETPMDVNNMPAPIATVGGNVGSYDDTTGVVGTFYYYRVGVVRGADEIIGDEIERYYGDLGPGPQTFIGGNMTAGFFGEVSSQDLISGQALADSIGFTGNIVNSNEPWLKFSIDSQIIFVAKKEYAHRRYNGVYWDTFNDLNVVYDNETSQSVNIEKYDLRVTLMTGGNGDPSTAAGGEWNRLIYNIHQDVPSDQVGDNWASYTDADLLIGRFCWMQETASSNSSHRVARGQAGLTDYRELETTVNDDRISWRPVLRLL